MSFMAMPMLAALAGGLAGIYLGSLAIEWAIARRLFDSPAIGIPAATFAAAVAMFGLYWFHIADNGAFTPWEAALAMPEWRSSSPPGESSRGAGAGRTASRRRCRRRLPLRRWGKRIRVIPAKAGTHEHRPSRI